MYQALFETFKKSNLNEQKWEFFDRNDIIYCFHSWRNVKDFIPDLYKP